MQHRCFFVSILMLEKFGVVTGVQFETLFFALSVIVAASPGTILSNSKVTGVSPLASPASTSYSNKIYEPLFVLVVVERPSFTQSSG